MVKKGVEAIKGRLFSFVSASRCGDETRENGVDRGSEMTRSEILGKSRTPSGDKQFQCLGLI